jgi:putative DNA primase/helicase
VHGSRGATLALRDGDRGLIVKCWAGCDPHDMLAMLRRRGLIACRGEGAWPAPVMGRSTDRADAARRTRLALRIWEAARDARGTPVVRYLAGRSITMPVPPSLRWAPALRRPDGISGPAMVARVDRLDGEM